MTPGEFIAKWRASELKERSASHEHFMDLCRMLGEPTPAAADPIGEHYCFERGKEMNKEIVAILGVGAAVLVAVWMTWRDVTFQLTDMNARLGRVEGVLIAQGRLDSQVAPEAYPPGVAKSEQTLK